MARGPSKAELAKTNQDLQEKLGKLEALLEQLAARQPSPTQAPQLPAPDSLTGQLAPISEPQDPGCGQMPAETSTAQDGRLTRQSRRGLNDITNNPNNPAPRTNQNDGSSSTQPPTQDATLLSRAAASNEECDGDPLGAINDDQVATVGLGPRDSQLSVQGQDQQPRVAASNAVVSAGNGTSTRKKPSANECPTPTVEEPEEMDIDLDLNNENNPHLITDQDGLICKPPGEPGRATSSTKKGYVLRRAMGYPPELPRDHPGREDPWWAERNETYLELHAFARKTAGKFFKPGVPYSKQEPERLVKAKTAWHARWPTFATIYAGSWPMDAIFSTTMQNVNKQWKRGQASSEGINRAEDLVIPLPNSQGRQPHGQTSSTTLITSTRFSARDDNRSTIPQLPPNAPLSQTTSAPRSNLPPARIPFLLPNDSRPLKKRKTTNSAKNGRVPSKTGTKQPEPDVRPEPDEEAPSE